MKKYGSYMIMFLFVSVMCIPFEVNASKQEDSRQKISCNPDAESCREVSKDYTVPYCVSLNAPVADYPLDCIWASTTNTLSAQEYKDEKSGDIQRRPLRKFETRNLIEQYCKALLGTYTESSCKTRDTSFIDRINGSPTRQTYSEEKLERVKKQIENEKIYYENARKDTTKSTNSDALDKILYILEQD